MNLSPTQRLFSTFALVFIPAALIACGSSTGSTGSSGSGGSGGASGAGGAAMQCTTPPAIGGSFRFSYVAPDGTASSCDNLGPAFSVDADGKVAQGSTAASWLIDTCAPSTGCMPALHTIQMQSDVPIEPPPVGTLVHLKASLEPLSGPPPINCALRLLVTNIAMWDGVMNPTAQDALPWFDPLQVDGSIFTATYENVCTINHPDPGCQWTESFYQATISLKADATTHTDPMLPKATSHIAVPNGVGANIDFTTRYVVSSNGNCENPGESAVWATRTQTP